MPATVVSQETLQQVRELCQREMDSPAAPVYRMVEGTTLTDDLIITFELLMPILKQRAQDIAEGVRQRGSLNDKAYKQTVLTLKHATDILREVSRVQSSRDHVRLNALRVLALCEIRADQSRVSKESIIEELKGAHVQIRKLRGELDTMDMEEVIDVGREQRIAANGSARAAGR